MITAKNLFLLMKEYGMELCEITEEGKMIRAERRLPPERAPVVYSPQVDAEALDNSAAMPEDNGEVRYTADGIYGEAELYPDGVDPVAEMRRAANAIRSDKSE